MNTEMEDVTRKRTKENELTDMISKLPNSLIDCILDRLPLRDAVRTSVLSRKWRHQWKRVGKLVFGEDFYEDIMRKNDEELLNFVYVETIGSVLLLHKGPIRRFALFVPDFKEGPPVSMTVNNWIQFVSSSGVREIRIVFSAASAQPLRLSSYIFDCQEVMLMVLHNCELVLPYNFSGFANLISLSLDRIHINGDGLGILISNCPLLEYLSLQRYAGSLSVTALKLRSLTVANCSFNELSFQNLGSLVTICFRRSYCLAMQPRNIITFFGLMRKLASVSFNALMLMEFGRQYVPETLHKPLKYLRVLTLLEMTLTNPDEMSSALCILRSSPYLQTLNLSISTLQTPVDVEAEEAGIAFLREQLSKPIYPNSLRTVKIKSLMGTQAEMMLLKSILTLCPALETLYANAVDTIRKHVELAMMSELMACHRASSKAKVNYSKGQGSAAVSYSNGQVDSSVFHF